MGAVTVVFSAEHAAAALWTYGEDELVERAARLTETELRQLWSWAGAHWTEAHGLPLRSRLVLDKVAAFACIQHFEGTVRPLRQERRRPQKAMPEHLRNARPVPPGVI